jgi:hypothetical protein
LMQLLGLGRDSEAPGNPGRHGSSVHHGAEPDPILHRREYVAPIGCQASRQKMQFTGFSSAMAACYGCSHVDVAYFDAWPPTERAPLPVSRCSGWWGRESAFSRSWGGATAGRRPRKPRLPQDD